MEQLFLRIRDFNVSENELKKCATEVADMYNISLDEVYHSILSILLEKQRGCIEKAAKHDMKLEFYQEKATTHMLTHRGLIVGFDVGTGKTLTAVTIASCILSEAKFLSKDITVIVITPTSLQENFKKEMVAYGSDPDDPRYIFYTLAGFANAYKRGEINCDKTLLIVDEAHNLRTDYRLEFAEFAIGNPKQNTRAEIVLKCAAKAWKVLLLTATSVYDYDHHIVNLVSMILGKYPPLDAGEFYEILGSNIKFRETLGCMFAFYKSSKAEYPDRIDKYMEIEMTPAYYKKYSELSAKIKPKKRKSGKSGKDAFMVKLRTATLNISPYLKQMVALELTKEGQKTLVYSEFLKGMEIFKGLLDEESIPYLQISGSTTKPKRAKIVAEYNSREGPNVLLISKAGGEGLDLKETRKVILLEKGWTVAGEHQVTGRAIRKKSHINLPLSEQNVTVYHLMMILPKNIKKKKDEKSADLYLFNKSRGKDKEAQILRDRLEQVDIFHIDCNKHPTYPTFSRERAADVPMIIVEGFEPRKRQSKIRDKPIAKPKPIVIKPKKPAVQQKVAVRPRRKQKPGAAKRRLEARMKRFR